MVIVKNQRRVIVIDVTMSKQLCFTILICLCVASANAQNKLEWLFKLTDFKPIMITHMKEVKDTEAETKLSLPVVSVVLFRPEPSKMEVYLTSVSTLVEIEEHLPSSFTLVEQHPFLIYDGSEQLISDKKGWLEQLKATVCKRLCDDSKERALAKKPGPKEIRFPCSTIYDAPIRKLTFVGGKLIKNELVGSVPYYEKLPVD
jgi:hypothetical protein